MGKQCACACRVGGGGGGGGQRGESAGVEGRLGGPRPCGGACLMGFLRKGKAGFEG